jgi:hypothetical protein
MLDRHKLSLQLSRAKAAAGEDGGKRKKSSKEEVSACELEGALAS